MNKTAKIESARHRKAAYKNDLFKLQVELVKLQRHIIANHQKILVIFEGRDAGGKDGTIKRIVAHLSPRETRVVALSKPSDRDRGSWYFQRFVPHLPTEQELVLFNRSWYNRAGVERVMGFCSEEDARDFLEAVPHFEQMLIRSGIRLFKYYLDISQAEQTKRLKARHENPLKQWKVSPIDEVASEHWLDYSQARNEMFAYTHNPMAPWSIVRADDKRTARLSVIRDLLSRVNYDGKDRHVAVPNPALVFPYDESYFDCGMIEP